MVDPKAGEGAAGAVDFGFLEGFAAGDRTVISEVLELFVAQAQRLSPSLHSAAPGWRDAVHTLKGSARGIGAQALGELCARAEAEGEGGLPAVLAALDAAVADIAAYRARTEG